MQDTQPISVQQERLPGQEGLAEAEGILIHRTPFFRRFLVLYLVLLGLLLLAIVPPLIKVDRLQRRIASSISQSLGRPVHLDRVSLSLLPLPGFTLENFVVSEDPTFGAEPVIRANTVRATLRVSSLWSRRVEFSTISLADPSVNLVHNPDGRWNVESILLQASRMPAAPTAQRTAGPAPRFPYIEATGARLNIKNGVEKLPFSLTEAEFALWLPNPQEWNLRLSARPVRTDSNSVSDTGTVDLEATLKRARSLGEVPLDLTARWHNVPLGEASRVLSGNDAGWRGELNISASVSGTINHSAIRTRIQASGVRRADFVPEHLLDIDASCIAEAMALFHAFTNIRCSWPPETAVAPRTLALTGTVPDIHQLESTAFSIGTPGVPAPVLLDWLRVLSPRISPDVTAAGTLSGSLSYGPPIPGSPPTPAGELRLSDASLTSVALGPDPIVVPTLILMAAPSTSPASNSSHGSLRSAAATKPGTKGSMLLGPVELDLGAKEPAILEGTFNLGGYTLHLSGPVLRTRLLALGLSLPQFGDGLADALLDPPPTEDKTSATNEGATTPPRPELMRVDLTATRQWGGRQTWAPTRMRTTRSAPRRWRPH